MHMAIDCCRLQLWFNHTQCGCRGQKWIQQL